MAPYLPTASEARADARSTLPVPWKGNNYRGGAPPRERGLPAPQPAQPKVALRSTATEDEVLPRTLQANESQLPWFKPDWNAGVSLSQAKEALVGTRPIQWTRRPTLEETFSTKLESINDPRTKLAWAATHSLLKDEPEKTVTQEQVRNAIKDINDGKGIDVKVIMPVVRDYKNWRSKRH